VTPAVAAPVAPPRWLLPAIALGMTLAPLNSTMIAVALPEIQSAFDASVTATAWLVTLYLVVMAVGQPIGGHLGDLLGRRRVYLVGLGWFAVASLGCALAPNLPLLIAFRAQQGLAGALTFPNGAALVRAAIPPERRGAAFGTVGLATGLAAASGPPLGGALVHLFGWSAIFWANVPVVAAALLLARRSLPHGRRRAERVPFDFAGSGLFAAALGALISVPTLLKFDRPALALLVGAGAVAAAAAFVRRELRAPAPLIAPRLFRRRAFAAACASIGVSNLVMYTSLLVLPLYVERVRGHDSRATGLTLAALSVCSALCGPIGGRWADSRGIGTPAVAGAVALWAGATGLAAAVYGSHLWPVMLALGAMGVGIGVAGAPVQTAALEAVPGAASGAAAGIYSTSRYLGSVVGSTALALLFATAPGPGAVDRVAALLIGLSVAALAGIAINALVAERPGSARAGSFLTTGLVGSRTAPTRHRINRPGR
jgi:DHA2 family methylenomycin A resistance protein-like MFS transporter